MRRGVWLALGAQFAWGLFPVYWKQIEQVPAMQVIAHRILWSFITLAVIALWRGHGLREITPRGRLLYAIAAVLISVNWFAYVWAVSNHLIVETSLGYFINPLVTVLIGVVMFGEKLRTAQWLAVGCAGAGVTYLTVAHGALPWVALALAGTFSAYSAVKKLAPLGSLDGLTVETAWVTLPALAYLLYAEVGGDGAFYHDGLGTTLYLAGAGLVTTIPLVLFAASVRNVPLTTIGILQYISPMLQLALGVLLYREPFVREQWIGFSGVWIGLIVFAVDGFRNRQLRVTTTLGAET
jgi:chloramphenicol-sensitive protein RarD